jgi:DNA polymerase-3 subunit beta
MEGDFVAYRSIIPTDNTTVVRIGKDILLESIERASLLAKEGKNNLIKMSIKNNLMTITSRSEEGNVKEEIVMEKTGEDLEIGFNSKFVLDVLKVIDDEEISMNFKTGVSPCVVKPVEGDNYEYLILPVRIPSM